MCLPWQPASILQPLENTGPFIKGIITKQRGDPGSAGAGTRRARGGLLGRVGATGGNLLWHQDTCPAACGVLVWTSISRGAATSWVPVVFPSKTWCSYTDMRNNDKSFGPLLIRLHAAESCRAGTVSPLGAGEGAHPSLKYGDMGECLNCSSSCRNLLKGDTPLGLYVGCFTK